jgi:hypothetical protein
MPHFSTLQYPSMIFDPTQDLAYSPPSTHRPYPSSSRTASVLWSMVQSVRMYQGRVPQHPVGQSLTPNTYWHGKTKVTGGRSNLVSLASKNNSISMKNGVKDDSNIGMDKSMCLGQKPSSTPHCTKYVWNMSKVTTASNSILVGCRTLELLWLLLGVVYCSLRVSQGDLSPPFLPLFNHQHIFNH